MKWGVGVESSPNKGSHLLGWGYDGATPTSGSVFRRTDFGGEGGKDVIGVSGGSGTTSLASLPPDIMGDVFEFFDSIGGADFAAASEFPLLDFFSKGAFIKLHKAPQFAMGISDSVSGALRGSLERGGNGGTGRALKPGGDGTTTPDCLVTMVGWESICGFENCLMTKQFAQR